MIDKVLTPEEEERRRKQLFSDYMTSPEMQDKRIQRLKLNDAGNNKAEARSMLWQLCTRPDNPAEGCIFFIENFGWTFDPRKTPAHIPFFLFEYQKESVRWLVDHIDNGRDALMEKSRDMGVTWIAVWVFVWYWLFHDGTNLLMGSYKEKLVDDKCYSDDTEVLTSNGWKYFKDVDITEDKIATRNKNKEFEWQYAVEKTLIDYTGKIYNLKSRTLDLLVSPNHRVLLSKNWGKNEHIVLAKNLDEIKNPCVPATSSWTGTKTEDKDFGNLKLSGIDFARFMGMYLAEGCSGIEGTKNSSRVQIYQKKESKGYKPYKEFFKRVFGRDCYYDRYFKFSNKELSEYLSQFGKSYEKFIPREIKEGTKEEIEEFLYFYMLGDGCWKSAMPSMSTVSKQLADDLQEIIQKIGKSSSISEHTPKPGLKIGDREFKSTRTSYTLRIRESEYQSVKVLEEEYSGKLGCVTVPNTIIYVRRNGKPVWSGNTDDSLFGRLSYSIDSLPKWLKPKNYNPKKHRTHLKIINPANGNLIAGESMSPEFGTGMRKLAVFFDELGAWDYAQSAWRTCLSEDHDVLTDRGWVPVRDVTTEDKVLSMDKKSGISKYMPVLEKTHKYYEKMIHFKGKSIDSIVSPDHNMLYETSTGNRLFKSAEEIQKLKSGSFILNSDGFIATNEASPQSFGFKLDDWMEFLGWYISEGCHGTSGGIKISQSSVVNPDKYKHIGELFDRMGLRHSSKYDHYYIWKGSIPEEAHELLKSLGKCNEKFIPQEYLNVQRQHLLRLWHGLLMGDGYISKKVGRKDCIGYITSSYILAGQVQELLQKLGFNASIHKKPIQENGIQTYIIRLKYKKRINLDKLSSETIDWNDMAYCLTTPLNTIFIRRNGLAYWIGNCGDVTSCRIANSTPKGQNFYSRLRNSGIDVLTLHWTKHPFKDDQWYAFERSRRDEVEVAQELDISYRASQEGRVYFEWNDDNVEYGQYEYDPGLPLYVGWDFGKTDDTAIIWAQPFERKMRIIDTYSRSGQNIDFFVPFITGIIPSDTYKYSKSEMELIEKHRNWKRGIHYGDPAGRFKNGVTDATVLSVLREHGITVNYKDSWKEHQNRKRAAKAVIREGILLNKTDQTEEFDAAMLNAAYPTPTVEGETVVRSQKPKHDWTSHYRSAFEYLALGIAEYTHRMTKPVDKFKKEYTDGRRRALKY